LDVGSNTLSGVHVSNVYRLRQYYGLDKPGTPVKVDKIFVMTGVVESDLKEVIGSDCAEPMDEFNSFGIPNSGFKEWQLQDGTPVLVPERFNTDANPDGSIYQYPNGDKSLSPSAMMPEGGFFFDAIERRKGADDTNLDPHDNVVEYPVLSDDAIEFMYNKVKRIYDESDFAINLELPQTNLGDVATIPGAGLVDPRGIRDIEEWYVSLYTRRDYIKRMFDLQTEVAIESLRKLSERLGDMVDFIVVSAADFGLQSGLLVPTEVYQELFKPFHKKINSFIHSATNWKTFIHTCGAVFDLVPDLIEARFDVMNPVQISAAGMDPMKLKREFGKDIVFHGGASNTQKTLPFGTPEQVKDETRRLIDIFLPGGGFIGGSVHIIQGNVPVENVVALVEAFSEYR